MAFLKLVAKRLIAQRLLALALLVTMAFSIGVLVAGPIYANASQHAILSGLLAQASTQSKNLRFVVYSTEGFDEDAAGAAIEGGARRLPVDRIIPQAKSLSTILSNGGAEGAAPLQGPVAFREGAFDHITLEGREPVAADQAAVPAGIALTLGLKRGDALLVGNSQGETVSLRVTAIFNPPSLRDPFWFGPTARLAPRFLADQPSGSLFPTGESTAPPAVLVTPEGYDALASKLSLTGEFVWDVYLDLSAATFDEIKALPQRIEALVRSLRSEPALEHLTGTTGLAEIVQVAEERTANLKVPIYLVVFQIGAVALAVLAGVASLTLSRQSFELALLKSRGFTKRQLLGAQVVQSLLAALAAFPLGLLLGAGLARLARSSNGPSVPGSSFPIDVTLTALVAGAVGTLVGVLLLVGTSLPHISRTVIEERQETSREMRPFLSRFPIELLAGVLGLAAFWEVRTRGIGPSVEGSIDPLVLLAPTLLLFAASFAALRLLLWAFRRLDGAIGRARSLSAYLAGRRLGRSAATSFATALLLVLSAGLLVVSTAYRATILRAHEDTAHQEVGADWQVLTDPASQSLAVMRKLPPGTTGVFRGDADLVDADQAVPVSTLGIDPETYPSGGWWRGDYADRPLPELLGELETPSGGVPLPEGTGELRLELSRTTGAAGMRLMAMVETSTGRVDQASFGVLGRPGPYTAPTDGPSGLLSLVLIPADGQETAGPISLGLSRFQAETSAGPEPIPLNGWQALRWRLSGGEVQPSLGDAVVANLDPGTGGVIAGLVPPERPIPAFASPDVVSLAGRSFRADIGGARLDFDLVEVLGGFPGIPHGQPFLVVPEDALYERTQRVPEPSIGLVEVWSMGAGDPVPAIRRTGLFVNGVQRAEDIVATLSQLPQSLAIGMHFTAAAGGMGLVVIGVAVGLYFGQRRRRFEFAALRAMGTERRQTTGALVGEQGVLVGFALLAAFLLGYGLLRVMMPYVAQSVGTVFPPVSLVLDWVAMALFGAAVIAATGVGLILAARALLRASVTAILRGEVE